MKLVLKEQDFRVFSLDRHEAECLRAIMHAFPISVSPRARISRRDTDPQTLEREELLNESLAEHRSALKHRVTELIRPPVWEIGRSGVRLTLTPERLEILIQILNSVRVACWRALGEPEELELNQAQLSSEDLRHFHLMHLAGMFEFHLLQHE